MSVRQKINKKKKKKRIKKQTACDNTFYYALLSLDFHRLVRHTAYLPYFS